MLPVNMDKELQPVADIVKEYYRMRHLVEAATAKPSKSVPMASGKTIQFFRYEYPEVR